ncbi:MAG: hypothetical protein LBN74_06680 [Prevotella sp.]|jgi:hypothetical protein|nr:hypothetical protein [Prevotella sp.]
MLNNFDKNKNPFKVPENYFEDFNSKIMERLPEKETKKTKIVPLWEKVLPWTAMAAAVFGVLFSVGVFDKKDVPSEKMYADQNGNAVASAAAFADTVEEDYYLFLQDEVSKSQYKEIMYNY